MMIETTVEYLKKQISEVPAMAIILGSGLSGLVDHIENPLSVAYKDIPHFPVSTVPGHDGKLIFGVLGGKNVVVMSGRFHYYEGYSTEEITYPIQVFNKLGISKLIITNAAGGIAECLNPGSIMLIKDHISVFMPSICRGNIETGQRASFVDMTEVYSLEARELTKKIAKEKNIDLKEGNYIFFEGPRYETPADVLALRALGADATGMSTVPETIVARYLDMKVLGLSYITNKAAGLSQNKLSHKEVMENATISAKIFVDLVNSVVKEWN